MQKIRKVEKELWKEKRTEISKSSKRREMKGKRGKER